jgi:hypothetical protein
MISDISPENSAFLDFVVATGKFASREAAIDEAVRIMRECQSPSGVTMSERKKSAEQWIKDLREWAASHPPVTHFVDDSRESIYEGRGE